MKSGSRGIHCTQRSIGSKMSQTYSSSLDMSSKLCRCRERLLLLKATTVKNKGRLFWRCRNWAVSDKFLIYWAKLISFDVLMVLFFFLQSNSHYNFFEWFNEEESKFEGNAPDFQDSGRTRVEEDEVCLEKEKVILELIKKNEKLKTKLQEEKRFGRFLQFFFLLSWTLTILLVFMLSFKFNCY